MKSSAAGIKLVSFDETPEFKALGLSAFNELQLHKLIDEDYTHYVLENICHDDGKHLYFSLAFHKTEASALLYYGIINKQDGNCLIGSMNDEAITQIASADIKGYYKARTKQRALARYIANLS